MQTLSPFFIFLFFRALANLQTDLCNSSYVISFDLSGSSLSQIIAISFFFVFKCLSIQFTLVLSFASLNQLILPIEKSSSEMSVHFESH